jgi:hypothetical protein
MPALFSSLTSAASFREIAKAVDMSAATCPGCGQASNTSLKNPGQIRRADWVTGVASPLLG